MKINPKYVSFYYQGMEEVPDMELDKKKNGASRDRHAEGVC